MFKYCVKMLLGLFLVLVMSVNVFGGGVHKKNTAIVDAPDEYKSLKNPYTSPADLKKGEKLYLDKCAECHGDRGEGDDEGAVVFNDKKYMHDRSDGQLFYISMEGNGEDATMEAWGPDSDYGLSEKKIWQMVAFIRQLAK